MYFIENFLIRTGSLKSVFGYELMNTLVRNIFFLVKLIFLTSCTTYYVVDDSELDHVVIGSNTYLGKEYEIISDVKISQIQIRHIAKGGDSECSESSQKYHHLEIHGPIDSDTVLAVKKLLENIKNRSDLCISKQTGREFSISVYLSSGGGYLKDGLSLGLLFRKESITTMLGHDAECFSSCAIAFLGGLYRGILGNNSKLLFHSPYTKNSQIIECEEVNDELKEYMKSMLGDSIAELLYSRTMINCSENNGWTLNRDAAEVIGII